MAAVVVCAGWRPGVRLKKLITGAQIRAGRLLLQWSVQDLADRAKLGVATIQRSEATDGEPMLTMGRAIAIRYTLEAAGVIFVEENGAGPGVRLTKGG